MNWKLIAYVAAGVTAGFVLSELLVASIHSRLILLTAVVAIVTGALLSMMSRIRTRKNRTTGAR